MLKADKETFLLASPAQAVSLAAGLAQRAECRNGPGWPRELGAEMALAGLAMAELGRWCIILKNEEYEERLGVNSHWSCYRTSKYTPKFQKLFDMTKLSQGHRSSSTALASNFQAWSC